MWIKARSYQGRILVVDQEDWCRQFLSQVIKLIGIAEFKLVTSVDEALEALEESPFDLLITDLHLPEHTRLLESCRQRFPAMRFILMTPQRAQVHHWIYVEQVEVVIKPLSLDEIARKIRSAIQQKHRHQVEEDLRRLRQGAFRI
ncbi:MAG: response regulator [Thermodesulfobacteriota bacterium]